MHRKQVWLMSIQCAKLWLAKLADFFLIIYKAAHPYLTHVVPTGSGDGLEDHLLAHNTGKGVLNAAQQTSLCRGRGGGARGIMSPVIHMLSHISRKMERPSILWYHCREVGGRHDECVRILMM